MVLKELCVVDVDQPFAPLYYLFAPRGGWQQLSERQRTTYDFERDSIHHLDWAEGHIRYCRKCVMHHIKQAFPNSWSGSLFYVMEAQANGQKLKFLEKEFPELHLLNYNITFDNLPFLPGNIICPHRFHGQHCAYLKCMRLCAHFKSTLS